VVGAVVLGGAEIEGLTDSKKLTKKRREALEIEIHETVAAWATGWVSAEELDEVGMSEALRLATRRAVEQIHAPYHEIIIDGTVNFLKDTSKGGYVTTLAKADLLVPSVSAASIVAKVARDRYMAELDATYPGYGLAKHAGYGVAAHRAAIEQLGVTPEHRLSFAPLQKYKKSPHPSSPPLPAACSAPFPQRRMSPTSAGDGASVLSEKRLASAGSLPRETTRGIGDASETAAANELVRRGHTIIERNWKTKYCEIDIISKKGDRVYFTEVKHRKNDKAGDGLAAITPKKLNQMKFAAKLYAHLNHLINADMQLIAIATTGDEPSVTLVVEIS
jgi:ribonuclease HII